ncbi:MAG: 50S ribosomal protein L11 methyltransferase [Clostridia bacterium]|nr:50S ribosomal protein L11 methyltransferase [Clostridia bacterium]
MIDQDYVCQDYGDVKSWTKIRVKVPIRQLDALTAVMSMITNQLEIEDLSDIDYNTCYGSLIDEKILAADKSHGSVSVYLPAEQNAGETLSFLKDRIALDKLDASVEVSSVNEEDWATSWKQYYNTVKVTDRVVIVPAWEEYEPKDGEIAIRMDPGMAFGTGTHETTKLIFRLLEKYVKPGDRVLDVGTGTGILSICAVKLGAKACWAYDLDPMSVRVARENVEAGGLAGSIFVGQSDLLASVDRSAAPFDIICANIVADILIRMSGQLKGMYHPGTVLMCSGVIDERADDVTEAMRKAGFTLFDREEENGWCSLAFRPE